MNENRKARFAYRIALILGVVAVIMLIGTIFLIIMNWDLAADFVSGELGYVLIVFTINGVLSILLGLLILSRNTRNGLGWIFLAIGFLFTWWEFSGALLEIIGLEGIPVALRPIVIAGGVVYLLPLMMTIALVPLFFPTGKLLSRRWRPVMIVAVIGIIGQTIAQSLLDLIEELPELNLSGIESDLMRLNSVMSFILISGIIGGMLSLIVRFVRSQGDERTQMKWLVYTAVTSISLMLLLSFILGEDSFLLGIFSPALPIYLTVAIGIAILRHKLFDIDIIIRRTLQYGLLTGILALVYFGSVVLLQNLVVRVTGEQSPVVIVISTLGIAALFNPLRTRVQEFIDHRFYRKKYDAERALDEFAAAARDEVEIDALTAAMLSLVDKTMQPEKKSLWLVSGKTQETL